MTEIMTADVDTQTPPDVSSDFVTTDDNEDELLHDISQDLQVTDKDHIVMQQTSDRQHQAIIVMPHSDSIVSTEEFQRSVLSLATNDNIVNDGSLAMMGDDVMNNTVVVTTLEEGSIEDAEEEGEIQVGQDVLNQMMVDDVEGLVTAVNSATCANINGHQVIILAADGTVTSVHPVTTAIPTLHPAKRQKTELDDAIGSYLINVTGDEVGEAVSVEAGKDDHQHMVQTVKAQAPELDVTQAWFTTRDDKAALQSKGHQWKQGQWTKEEVELLQANIANYCKQNSISDPTLIVFEMSKDERKDFYRTIAQGLQRPLFSVYRRVIRMYDQKNHIGKYTQEEIIQLRELRSKHGSDWASIGATLGRSASSVKDRCRLMKDTCNSGKWLPEEETRLAAAVYTLSGVRPGENITSGLSWAAVAEKVATRSEKQCRTKWLNYLNWKQTGGSEWTRDDDILLLNKIAEAGLADETLLDWTQLACGWSSVRSPQWLRGKWWSMKRHVPDYQMLSFPEIVDYVRNAHNQLRGVRTNTGNLLKLQHIDFQQVNVVPNLISIPILAADGSTSLDDGTAGAYQTYEVVQGYNPTAGGAQAQGTFLITQPHSNPALSFTTTNMTSDHIIVHTLPISHASLKANPNVMVRMNPQNIVLQAADDQHDTEETTPTMHLQEGLTEQDAVTERLESLSEDDSHLTHHPSESCEVDQLSLAEVHEEVTNEEEEDIGGEIEIKVEDAFDTQTIDVAEEVDQSDMDPVTSDLAISSPPEFVASTTGDSDLILMSALSDPMLTSSDSTDLIGSSSDIEVDKSNQSNEANSPDPHS